MKSIALSVAAFLIGASCAYAEPISVAGLSWKNTHLEMAEILRKGGFNCPDNSDVGYTAPVSVMCERSEPYGHVFIHEKTVDFDCSVFTLCDTPLKDVARKFVETGKVEKLSPKVSASVTKNIRMEYCGSGPEGDVICLEGNSQTNNLSSVILYKAAFGAKSSFD